MNARLFLIVLLLSAPLASAQSVLPPPRRAATVEQAERLIRPPAPTALPTAPKNPFALATAPVVSTTSEAVDEAPAVSSRSILEEIAYLVNPSGVVELGGQPILLFGQKRIKVGDSLSITFDGQPYVLVITAIQSTSFTLRLRGEEITRPIKLATRP